jgi:hypothetical protein
MSVYTHAIPSSRPFCYRDRYPCPTFSQQTSYSHCDDVNPMTRPSADDSGDTHHHSHHHEDDDDDDNDHHYHQPHEAEEHESSHEQHYSSIGQGTSKLFEHIKHLW